jgi:hypothetical protein
MPLTSELTVEGVLLHKHAGGDGYHYYRGTMHATAVTFRPTLGANGKPLGWRCYDGAPACIATGETLTLAVQRADYSLGLRAESRRPKP